MALLDLPSWRGALSRYVLHDDVPPEQQRAFLAFASENNLRVIAGVGVLFCASLLCLWPLDAVIFLGNPALLGGYDAWRPETVGLIGLVLALLGLVKPLRPRAFEVALLLAGIATWNSARLFVPFDGLDGPFAWLSYAFQFMLVPMLVALPLRLLASLWLDGCFLLGALAARPELPRHRYFAFFLLAGALVNLANVVFGQIVHHLARRNFLQRLALSQQALALAEAIAKSERLLRNILPAAIAERLKEGPQAIADRFGEVTVLFADICEFTPLSESLGPEELVQLLNRMFTELDALVERRGLEKIKTIGDAYMVAGGLPAPRTDHARAVADLALDMVAAAERWRAPDGRPVQIRIGVHSGPVVAGVIGSRKFSYDLWGDTVNIASRMESHGVPGGVTVSETTRALLGDGYTFEDRGLLPVKGKGEMHLWRLTSRRATEAPAA
ncbi:MAG: adenylate/guanylate cyclase domain-containing protein [Myxococcales bacterium]